MITMKRETNGVSPTIAADCCLKAAITVGGGLHVPASSQSSGDRSEFRKTEPVRICGAEYQRGGHGKRAPKIWRGSTSSIWLNTLQGMRGQNSRRPKREPPESSIPNIS